MTLLLGPPASGKTTLMLALAGKLDKKLKTSGRITYCGHELSEFVPQRTSAYISQHDLHYGEMTVRETIDFSARCLGTGTRFELLSELSRRERDAGIKPDPEIDAFMKAMAVEGKINNIATDYILKILGLDICSDIIVGDEMRRGISGGQRKRVTTAEMLAGPARALFMDEISTGLDSATTFQIVKFIRQMVHIFNGTVMVSLLQPAPETYNLFDDIILLSEGRIVYHGPRENILEFFQSVGFRCPERKAVADFLQEVTSKKDQEQYWMGDRKSYRYISSQDFSRHFKSFHIGERLTEEIKIPYDKSKMHPAALTTEKYGMSNKELFKATLSREWLLMKRNSFVYQFRIFQITILAFVAISLFFRTTMPYGKITDSTKFFGALFFSLTSVMFNGFAELSITVTKLPVFYKQRDYFFFPAWAFVLSNWILSIPVSFIESGIWLILTYYPVGYAPAASRFFRQLLVFFLINQLAGGLFRLIASIGKTRVVANSIGTCTLLILFVLGGFIISKDDIKPWWIWGFWSSPLMYGVNAVFINEFLDPRWGAPNPDKNIDAPTVGTAILKSRALFTNGYWYWIAVGALAGFTVVFNLLFVLTMTYLNPASNVQNIILDDASSKTKKGPKSGNEHSPDNAVNSGNKGMVLPFQPLSLAFSHLNYYVDMPQEMKNQGFEDDRLQLLSDVSGAFRPGILTALVGVSGAGKTTLMDVLAGRKTGGYIEGEISISGYPKKQETFARISGYCEQNDIHSPNLTVYESLVYSAWLRLSPEINGRTRMMFVEEIMELVELSVLRDCLVGLPGIDGLSTEQRKRLTIAVELVANPSIVFMDEPTSGLDARAAAIVMRTVRNTVNTGRTVVCTIHQPSIDIFESFDELLLMKLGGQVIYAGELGRYSQKLIEYFEAIPGIPKIKPDQNPATWMLEVTTPAVEAELGVNFAEVYAHSALYQKIQDLIKELSIPVPGTKDLSFPTKYSQNFATQCIANFWKQYWSFWRNPGYNTTRILMTILVGLLFGTMFWNKGGKTSVAQDLQNLLGAIYAAIFFLGASNATAVQPVVNIERTVFYREKAAGMYSPLSYAIAQLGIEIVYNLVQGTIYTLLLFSMIGFKWEVSRFFYFLFFIAMSFNIFTLYGMMAVSFTPNHHIAAIVSSFFYVFWNAFTGYIIPRPSIPVWWRWYYWADPVSWSIYGVIASQLGDKENMVEIPGAQSLTVKEYLSENLGYRHDFLGYVVLAHFAFMIVFLFVFAYSIKSFNFQKR
ncbi:ABC transporter G family member 48-like isoform X2 [Carex rostrata]